MEKICDNNLFKKGGIYKITNKINGKFYIGSTVSFQSRYYQHCCQLKQNKHFNTYLQNNYNKYGSKNFIFEIIDVIEANTKLQAKNDRIFVEQIYLDYYFDFMNQCYNFSKKAISSIKAKRFLEKRTLLEMYGPEKASEIRMKLINSHKNQKNPNKGRKLEDFLPKEKVLERKRKNSIVAKTHPNCIRVQFKKGQTREEKFGKEKAEEYTKILKQKNSGINSVNFGKPRTEEVKKKIGVKNCKFYDLSLNPLISPEGIEYKEILNLTQFCAQNKISKNLCMVLNKKRKYCIGNNGGIWKLKYKE